LEHRQDRRLERGEGAVLEGPDHQLAAGLRRRRRRGGPNRGPCARRTGRPSRLAGGSARGEHRAGRGDAPDGHAQAKHIASGEISGQYVVLAHWISPPLALVGAAPTRWTTVLP